MLIRKLGTKKNERFVNFILPKRPSDLTFTETVSILTDIFGEQQSLLNIRYNCFKLSKNQSDDFVTYAGHVNHECERFHLQTLTDDQFKCLIFIAGLQSPNDSELRSRPLVKLETDKNVTVQDLMTECNRLLSLKKDTMLVQQSTLPSQTSRIISDDKYKGSKKKQPSTCWSCGEWHDARFCPFKKHECQVCHKRGHKENFCHPPNSPKEKSPAKQKYKKKNQQRRSNTVSASFKIDFKSRRRYISVGLNESPVRFQFDTASDITLISHKTWTKIGKPNLIKTNHIAKSASGNDIKLTGELKCSVSFRNKVFTGTCYVTDTDLNLIGLDWIEELDLFTVPLESVFNSFSLTSTQDTAKHFTQMLKSKFSDLFRRIWDVVRKRKPLSS